MIYRELSLPEPLRRVAFCAWQFILEPGDPSFFQHQVPPDGTTGLTLVRSPDGTARCGLVGPMLTALTVPVAQGFAYAGIRLRPEMGRIATGGEARPNSFNLVDEDGSLAPVWQDLQDLIGGKPAWSRTIESFCVLENGDPAVADGVDRLIASSGTMPVSQVAALSQLSERQFRRRFLAATGVTPKQYADVQRVRRALILALEDPDLAGVAHDSGFADQPHFARDVKERFGAAPRRVSGYFCGIRHELLEDDDDRNLQASVARAA